MIKFFTKQLRNKKGFTLVELIVVIAILGILAAIAVPKISSFRTEAAKAAHEANVRTLQGAANMYLASEGTPATGTTITWNGTNTGWGNYIEEWPTVPGGTGLNNMGESYTVTIDDNGKVTVEPGRDGGTATP